MPKILNKVYVTYIRSADPGFFMAKYAGKAAVSCFAALLGALIVKPPGAYMFWWMVGAVCTVLFRTGSTFERRKMYALVLLGFGALCAPMAALAGKSAVLSLVFVFGLSFSCFFVAPLGVSASTLGVGCLIISLISVFSPADLTQGLARSACLLSGGLISFVTNFYLWPFDPEKVLLASARLAVEDMGYFWTGLCTRIKDTGVTDKELVRLNVQASESVRRYRTFMESFNIDPLKGSRAAGGPGIFYFSLIRLFESLVGLFNHIHFSDNRPEFRMVRDEFFNAATALQNGFDAFSRMQSGRYAPPQFESVFIRIGQIQERLLDMGAYKRGDDVQDKFLDAWGAVYELKNVARGLEQMTALANLRFRLEGKS